MLRITVMLAFLLVINVLLFYLVININNLFHVGCVKY